MNIDFMISNHDNLFKTIRDSISRIDLDLIPKERRKILDPLADYIFQKYLNSESIRLIFVCSHNSRRSHLAQIWAQTMAYNFGIAPVACYSAGTEATEMVPAIGSALRECGFELEKISDSANPVSMVKYAENEAPIIAFSKSLEHKFNPSKEFAAIMVCSEADEACPYINGAEARFAISYSDPKVYDNTPYQKEKYLEKSREIARELYYVFSEVKRKGNISGK